MTETFSSLIPGLSRVTAPIAGTEVAYLRMPSPG